MTAREKRVRTKAAVLFAIVDAQKVDAVKWANASHSYEMLGRRAAARLGAWRALWWW